MFLVILPRIPCLILIFQPIRIILVEIFRVIVFVTQTVRAVVCTPADDKLPLLTPYRSSIPDFAAPRSEPPRFLWLPQIPDRDRESQLYDISFKYMGKI